MKFENVDVKELQVPIFRDGKLVYHKPKLDEIRDFVTKQLDSQVWEEEQRFTNPHTHYVDLSKKLYDIRERMLSQDESGKH